MSRGKEVECGSEYINTILNKPLHSTLPYEGWTIAQSLDDMKGWLAPVRSDTISRWMDARDPIEKRDLIIVARFWFGFISSIIMPSQNESILCHSKAACLGSTMSRRRIDLGLLISQEMAMRAKQKQTSLPFPVLITKLCRHAGAPRYTVRDIEFTPSSSIYIRRIEAEYIREKADERRAVPADISLDINVDLLPAEVPGSFSSSQPVRTTQAMIMKMGNLSYSTDGSDNEDAPKTSGIPQATTGEVQRDGTANEESDAEIDEEHNMMMR
uniref:Putative plant transposon protein domain-containing protein n=1 Tax=Solanum tuberosum TaxID=4113 RepID=M1DI65_SOLTU